MSNFSLFWKIYAAKQYGKLWFSIKATAGGLFGRARPDGWNPYLMFDHGAVWRLLRDVVVLFTTTLRILFGLLVLTTMLVLAPPLIVLRALMIPFIGVVRGLRLQWMLRGHREEDDNV